MSFKTPRENGPCMHCIGQVVPQASRRVVWGVLSNLTIPLQRHLKQRLPFPSRQQSTVWVISLPTRVTIYQGPKCLFCCLSVCLFVFKQAVCP